MNNPFTLSFWEKPVQYISRIAQTENNWRFYSGRIAESDIYDYRSKRFRKNCNDD